MYTDGQIYMGLADGQRVNMPLNMSNRHGLIAGASGTGKTITMKAMAESFSDAGVPVFLCDMKGMSPELPQPVWLRNPWTGGLINSVSATVFPIRLIRSASGTSIRRAAIR